MLLREQGQFNDLSPELRKKLEDKVLGFGKTVRYKFDISNENPDPTKHGGKVIWPNEYILDPATFYINDSLEKRAGKSKTKRIGMVDTVDDKGNPTKFRKVKVNGKYKGVLKLELQEISEHFDFAVYLEMHPKLSGGEFADKAKRQIITRIDEQAAAVEATTKRTARKKALDAAENMSEKDVLNFCDAMGWDNTLDPVILKNLVEEQAENDPVYFNDIVQGKTVEYRAAVQQALNKGVILFDPADYSFCYAGNKQKITILSPAGEQGHVEKFSDWLIVGGDKATAAYKQIQSLNKAS